MLLLQALLGVSIEFRSEPTISYECPGKQAKAVFAELSALSGQKWLVGQSIAGEPLVVYLADAPISKVKSQLAYVLDGTWMKEKDGERLLANKPPKGVTPFSERMKVVEALKAATRKALSQNESFDEAEATRIVQRVQAFVDSQGVDVLQNPSLNSSSLRGLSPLTRLAQAVFVHLDSQELAQIGMNEKTVWSTHPTSLQRPLPSKAVEALESGWGDLKIWSHTLDRNPALMSALQRSNDSILLSFCIGGESGIPLDVPSRILITTSSRETTGISILIRFFNSRGELLLTTDSMFYEFDLLPTSLDPKDTWPSLEKPIPVSKLGTEISAALREWAQHQGEPAFQVRKPVLSPELHDALTSPEKIDPIALSCGGFLISYAKAMYRQLIACPLDDLALAASPDSRGFHQPHRYVNQFYRWKSKYRWTNEDGFLSLGIDPVYRAKSLKKPFRINRNDLGRIIRTCVAQGNVSLAETALLVRAANNQVGSVNIGPLGQYLTLLGIDRRQQLSTTALVLTSIWDSIPLFDQKKLLSGKRLLYERLPVQTRNAIRYASYRYIHSEFDVSAGSIGPKIGMSGLPNIGDQPFFIEATSSYSPDLPEGSFVALDTSQKPSMFCTCRSETGEQYYAWMDIEEIAHALSTAGITIERILVVSLSKFELSIVVPSESMLVFSLPDQVTVHQTASSIADLPKLLRRDIEAEMTRIRKENKIPPLLKQAFQAHSKV